MIELLVQGHHRVANKLRRLAAQMPTVGHPAIRRWLKTLRATLKSEPYPPKRPGQRYVRTGTLANRWAVVGDNRLVNRTPYGPFVLDETRQAWMHHHRWWTWQGVVRREAPALVKDLTHRYQAIWGHG